MKKRGVIFTTIMILVALVVTAPTILYFGYLGWMSYHYGGGRLPFEFFGIDRNTSQESVLNNASMVRNRFYWCTIDYENWPSHFNVRVHSADAETGEGLYDEDPNSSANSFEVKDSNAQVADFSVVGDASQAWVVDRHQFEIIFEVFELEGSHFIAREPTNAGKRFDTNFQIELESVFVWNGILTVLSASEDHERNLFQWYADHWQSRGEIGLLDLDRRWQFKNRTIDFTTLPVTFKGFFPSPFHATQGTIRVIVIGSVPHLFWHVRDELLYSVGIHLESPDEQSSVSALEPMNVASVSNRWSSISNDFEYAEMGDNWFPVSIGGGPGLVVIDRRTNNVPIARALRLEVGKWTEFASIELPFASCHFNAGSSTDNSMSYIVATTPLARSRVVAIESTGFRYTKFDHSPQLEGLSSYYEILANLAWSLIAGLILSFVTTILMWRDRAQYEFGHQTVALASIWERGMARVIDIFLLVFTAIALGMGLSFVLRPDWRVASEALNVEVFDHPALVLAGQIVAAAFGSFLLAVLTFVVIQGRFGITPGKWICGLRVVRSTLKPCGFARSLLREILICIDSLNFISWVPGILSIAYSEFRQRFGDRVADTIVLRSRKKLTELRELRSPPPTGAGTR